MEAPLADQPIAAVPRRLAAWALDSIIAGVALLPLALVVQLVGVDVLETVTGFWLVWSAGMVSVLVYLIAFDGGGRGATPAKRLLGIRVADAATRAAIGYPRATVRRLVYLTGGLPLYVGWLWALIDSRRQTWHDKAARSVVVSVR